MTTEPTLGLLNFQASGAGNTAQPLHLIDVTSWMNTNGGTLQSSSPIYTMVSNVNGNVI